LDDILFCNLIKSKKESRMRTLILWRYLCVSIVVSISSAAPVSASSGSLSKGSYVKFITQDGQEHYGTIEDVPGPEMFVLRPDRDGETILAEELYSYTSTGQTQTIRPKWSYSDSTVLIYEFVKTNGEIVRGGFSRNPVWWIVDTNGKIWRTGGDDFRDIRPIDSLPAGGSLPTDGDADLDAPPPDLQKYQYRVIKDGAIEVYMDRWGLGYVYDTNLRSWTQIPDLNNKNQPAYTDASDTMVLIYGWNEVSVYDTDTGEFSTISLHRGRTFAPFTRTETREYAAQCNDDLAMAAGTAWNAVYDRSLHRWFYLSGGADDSTDYLDENLVLSGNQASIKVLNDAFYIYELGKGFFRQGTKDEIAVERPSSGCFVEIGIYTMEVPPGGCRELPKVRGFDRSTGQTFPLTDVRWTLKHGPGTLSYGTVCVDEDAVIGLDELLLIATSRKCEDRDALTILVRKVREPSWPRIK
jgi:hypothetical protein